MDNTQELVSWLAIIALMIVVMTVYRESLSAILFTPPAIQSSDPNVKVGPFTVF